MREANPSLVAVVNLREFFHDSMQEALTKRHVQVEAQTEQYVVNVLTTFARVEDLFEQGSAARTQKPLAMMLAEALGAPTARDRDLLLQRLGDVALFTAGFFSRSFARKLVDIDYHIAMGSRAYSTLAAHAAGSTHPAALTAVFVELADKFQPVVDVLNDIADMSHAHTHEDALRLYEIYQKTGSPRALEALQALGISPIVSKGQTAQ